MLSRLAGKVAIVTGAAGGIGSTICSKFASEGASLVLVDLNKDGLNKVHQSLTKEFGDQHLQACGDVSDFNFTADLFAQISKKYGQPGCVLVNNAGISIDHALEDFKVENFDKSMNVNVKSMFLLTKEFVSALKTDEEMKPASIINISSIVGKYGCNRNSTYATTKAGIIGFTKSIGIEFGPCGIRCNAVLPGIIMTPMTAAIPDDYKKMFASVTPLKRLGKPEDVADACLFLASEESSFVTCSCLEVSGGIPQNAFL